MTPERKAEIEELAANAMRQGNEGIANLPDDFPFVSHITTSLAITELLADNERLEKRAKDQTIALTGLTCGGSEFFVREGEAFYADIEACVRYVRDRQADQHREIVKRVGLQKAAESKLAKATEALRSVYGATPATFPDALTRVSAVLSELEDSTNAE